MYTIINFLGSIQGLLQHIFASEVITSYSSNWIRLFLLGTSAPLVLCCDWFDRGSRLVKRDLVDLVTVDFDNSNTSPVNWCSSSHHST